MLRHTPLTERELAELRALCGDVRDESRVRAYASRLIVDVVALREELRRERERALLELERVRDVLERTRPFLFARPLDDELDALLAEVEDCLARRPR